MKTEEEISRNLELLSNNSLKEEITEWLVYIKFPTIQRTTYDTYFSTAERLIFPYIGNVPALEVSAIDIQKLLNTLKDKGLAFATTKKARLILNEFYNYKVLRGEIAHSPLEILQPAKRAAYESSQGKEVRACTDRVIVFTPEEIEMMRDAYFAYKDNSKGAHKQAAVYFLLLNTGLRRGEICGLLNRDIDMRKRILWVRRTVKNVKKRVNGYAVPGKELIVGTPKTINSIRSVPLNFVALEMIKQLRKDLYLGMDKPLLCNNHGDFTIPDTLSQRFRMFQIAAGIAEPKPLHALRHTFATNLINGITQPDGRVKHLSVKQVADILGHKTSTITEQYYVKRDFTKLKGITDGFEF